MEHKETMQQKQEKNTRIKWKFKSEIETFFKELNRNPVAEEYNN